MLCSLCVRFQPNTATHGQSNVINATVAITMPDAHPGYKAQRHNDRV